MDHVQIDWDDEEQTIICCTFMEGWTLDEFHEAYAQTGDMIRHSPTYVLGVIVDDSRNTIPPPQALATFKRIFIEGTVPMVIIGRHQLTQLLIAMIAETVYTHRRILQASNLEEARELLKNSPEDPTNA